MTTPSATAKAPNRATTSFTIAWGMVSIPVSAYTGTQDTRVARKEFLIGTDVPVGRAPIRRDDGSVIESKDVVRKAQAPNGEWVVLSDDEIADCTAPKGVGQVVTFVKNEDREHYLAENQMQVRPRVTKGKVDPGAERAFALLAGAMADRNVSALIKVSLRGPARYGLLDSDGVFTLIKTADAIRESLPMPSVQFSSDEMAMARNLIDTVGVDIPVLADDTAPVVAEYVESKATGEPLPEAPTAAGATDDLMAALQASIDAQKAKAS